MFSTDEWIDFLIRGLGLEPSFFDRRLKLLLLVRLIPFCEHNYNMVELGPRGTGKSYAYQEISPYGILLTGPTTVANLFYNMSTGKMGLVGLWDVVAIDEVADLQKMRKEIITMLKTYAESGTFARGKEALAYASIALFGNTNQPVEVMVRSSHLFARCLISFAKIWPSSIDCTTICRAGSPQNEDGLLYRSLRIRGRLPCRSPAGFRKHNYTDTVDKYFQWDRTQRP